MKHQVIAIPGGVNPAPLRYASLVEATAGKADLHLKELEVYAGEEVPAGYSIEQEVEALRRFADAEGLERFHLVGYSAGGFLSLAFAGAYPERLLSLSLFEPAGVPGERTAEERMLDGALGERLSGLVGGDFMAAFMQHQLRPGVELAPPAGPAPAWMRTRPAGLRALMAAFPRHPFDRETLRRCDFPVLLGHGDLSGVQEETKVSVLARLLPDVHIRRFAGIHHFVPAEALYTPEHVALMRGLWQTAEARQGYAVSRA